MKRYIRSGIDWGKVGTVLFKVKASEQPIDMEDYDDYSYVLKFYFYRGADYKYELVCEDDWVDPDVAAYAENFRDDIIQIKWNEDKLALELWNKELRARGIDKLLSDRDLQMAVNRCYW